MFNPSAYTEDLNHVKLALDRILAKKKTHVSDITNIIDKLSIIVNNVKDNSLMHYIIKKLNQQAGKTFSKKMLKLKKFITKIHATDEIAGVTEVWSKEITFNGLSRSKHDCILRLEYDGSINDYGSDLSARYTILFENGEYCFTTVSGDDDIDDFIDNVKQFFDSSVTNRELFMFMTTLFDCDRLNDIFEIDENDDLQECDEL